MTKLIVPLGLILISVVIIVLLIIPGWQHFLVVRANNRHLEDINTEIDSLTQKRDLILDQINRITKEDFDRLNQIMPSGAQGPEFLVSLGQLADAYQVEVTKLDLLGTVSTKPKAGLTESIMLVPSTGIKQTYQSIDAIMDLKGSYESFKNFLKALEQSVRITDVNSLSIAPDQNVFSIKFSLKTYYSQ